jgi:hypothetical protein
MTMYNVMYIRLHVTIKEIIKSIPAGLMEIKNTLLYTWKSISFLDVIPTILLFNQVSRKYSLKYCWKNNNRYFSGNSFCYGS